jgi:DNA-binding transcriptional regulator YiaG
MPAQREAEIGGNVEEREFTTDGRRRVSAAQDSAHQAIRRWARTLRAEREQLTKRMDSNNQAAVELLREATEVGFDLEEVAGLLGVSSDSLIAWRDASGAGAGARRD